MLTEDLKENTYPEHQAAEKKMALALKKMETPADYIRMLNWMYGFYAPLEALIHKQLTPDLLPDVYRRSRAEYLLWDICETGRPSPEFRVCGELPEIETAEQAIGALYVLEGSIQGGRIIAGIIRRQLGAGIRTSYFNGYGEENNSMWQAYKDFLDQPRTREQQTSILEAAKATFITFRKWIDKHEHQPQL